jgi:magnesium-transporting ATPase (P-type)
VNGVGDEPRPSGLESSLGQSTPWHSVDGAVVAQALGTDARTGLSRQVAAERLQQYGPNRLPAPPRRPAWLRLLSQFHNVLIYVMVGAAAITLAIGHLIDTAVLMAAVVVNAIIGFIQEGKAETALDAIRQMLCLRATVVRDGERMDVLADDLVPGDVVSVASGDRIPADLRLVSAKNLRVDESLLTGESVTVAKSTTPVAAAAVLAERRSMLYSGSLVASGSAVGIVVATGVRTELGSIGSMIAAVGDTSTPLVRQMAHFSRWLAAAILVLSALTFVLGVAWRGEPASEMFMMVVALAASAIPEGLPAIMTVTLALGVQRMARRNAIVRKLPAVETLGAVTVICSDKTGTLTKNEMTVQRTVTAPGVFEITGVGYAPNGAVHLAEQVVGVQDDPVLMETARCAALCNDASLRPVEQMWTITGDPTEGALLTFAVKAGLDLATERSAMPRADVIPFESEHRFMATLHRDHRGHAVIYVKGAPEVVMSKCSSQMERGRPAPMDVDYWRRQSTDLAARGMRILALACKSVDASLPELTFDDIESGCTLLALVGMIDPPREEAIAAVAECHAAGVRVKMITGDHADTAKAIGAQLGIGRGKPALTGSEIEVLDDAALRDAVGAIDVYARASPEHKLRLVQALQANGAVVAMTGDGVNDAPALKRADIGVAMGRKGTDAAKEAADMVLADDNFATIGKAIREGRAVYDNIKKFILFMLPTNGGEALVVIAAILFELMLPMTPAQILWINMVTSSTLGLALAFEAAERDVMQRPPRDPGQRLLSGFFAWRILLVSTLMMIGALGLFLLEMRRGASLETARTMAVSAVVACEMFYLVNSRFILASVLSREGLFGNPYVLAAIAVCALLQIAFVHAPPLQAVFSSTGLSLAEWGRVLAAGLLVFVIAELEKVVQRRRRRGPRLQPTDVYRASELRVESP